MTQEIYNKSNCEKMSNSEVEKLKGNMKFVLTFPENCDGCRLCELACAMKHYKVTNPSKSRVSIIRLEPKTHSLAVCVHCVKPKCMDVCPEDAISKDSNTGLVSIDPEKCTGCGLCIQACPWNVPRIEPESGIAIICDLCDSSPVCVEVCPNKALEYGTWSRYSQRRQSIEAKLKSEILQKQEED